MCTRYALDITQPELKEIMEIAKRSPLTTKYIDTHARPLVTDGEVRQIQQLLKKYVRASDKEEAVKA